MCIIFNQRDLFVGKIKHEQMSITTCYGEADNKWYIVTVRLLLTDDSNVNHPYNIPRCI